MIESLNFYCRAAIETHFPLRLTLISGASAAMCRLFCPSFDPRTQTIVTHPNKNKITMLGLSLGLGAAFLTQNNASALALKIISIGISYVANQTLNSYIFSFRDQRVAIIFRENSIYTPLPEIGSPIFSDAAELLALPAPL